MAKINPFSSSRITGTLQLFSSEFQDKLDLTSEQKQMIKLDIAFLCVKFEGLDSNQGVQHD